MSVEHIDGSSASPLLELSNVTKYFGGLAAVQDVDFKVWPQQIVSVIGPNGAGKTTVFNLITGIYRPTSGDIRLADHSLVGLKPDEIVQARHHPYLSEYSSF